MSVMLGHRARVASGACSPQGSAVVAAAETNSSSVAPPGLISSFGNDPT